MRDNKSSTDMKTDTRNTESKQAGSAKQSDSIEDANAASSTAANASAQQTDTARQDSKDDLPVCVRLNPRRSAMFHDELSGIYLFQGGGKTADGADVNEWAMVPKDKDCRRIKAALALGILLPCGIGGISKDLPPPEFKGKIDDLMQKPLNELLTLVDQTNDVAALSAMKEYEMSKKKRRPLLINSINRKLNAAGPVSAVKQSQSYIRDQKTGKMVKDVVTVR